MVQESRPVGTYVLGNLVMVQLTPALDPGVPSMHWSTASSLVSFKRHSIPELHRCFENQSRAQ